MYKEPFYITEKIGNNAFNFEKRRTYPLAPSLVKEGGPRLFVPSLIKINDFSEIKLLNPSEEKITFEDFGFDDKLSTNFGLENFYEIEYKTGQPHRATPTENVGGSFSVHTEKKIYLFDNHNHALYFWYLAKEKGLIAEKNNILYHIDEHADYRDPGVELEKTDLKSIFDYTNFSDINVGNYIIPAEKEGLIGKTIQIRNTKNLEDYLENNPNSLSGAINKKSLTRDLGFGNIILNLDLDFFQPDLDFIDYELKKKVVLDIAKKASVITVSTSPFFIDQDLAIRVFKDLFDK